MEDQEYGWAPRTDRMLEQRRDEEIRFHLNSAHNHVQDAQKLVYGVGRQYRGWRYRVALGKAQSVLIGLLKKELNRKGS